MPILRAITHSYGTFGQVCSSIVKIVLRWRKNAVVTPH